jgi:hypothetical protein
VRVCARITQRGGLSYNVLRVCKSRDRYLRKYGSGTLVVGEKKKKNPRKREERTQKKKKKIKNKNKIKNRKRLQNNTL